MKAKCWKNPHTVEAIKLIVNTNSIVQALLFTGSTCLLETDPGYQTMIDHILALGGITLYTPYGVQFVKFNDYILKYEDGSVYPCDWRFFSKYYESED